MQIKYVHIALKNGYLENWLVAGPQKFVVNDESLADGKQPEAIAQLYADPNLSIDETPVERGPVSAGLFRIGDFSGSWDYLACDEDHRVDQSGYAPVCTYLRSWAYNHLYSKVEQTVTLHISACGPFRVWLNGVNIYVQENVIQGKPAQFSVPLELHKGGNPLFIRFENVGVGQYAHFFTARLSQPGSQSAPRGIEVRIPSLIKTISRRNQLEKSFHTLYLDHDVYAWDQQIILRWPPAAKASEKDERVFSAMRLVHRSGRIFGEAEVDGIPGDRLILGNAAQCPEGFYDVLLMPKLWEFYEHGLRMSHKISIWNAGRRQFAELPVGTSESRKREALEYAASQEQASVEREMARMALSKWDLVDEKPLLLAVERVMQRQEGSLRDVFSLLELLGRFGDHEKFPAQVKPAVEKAALAYRYDPADAGQDVINFTPESRQLLATVCQILAGQRYSVQVFSRSKLTGTELRQRGELLALDWLRQRASWGFAEWGSEPGLDEISAGLSALVDLAEAESVWEMAAAVMDKLFFTLALNMFKGVYGGTSCQVAPLAVKGGMASVFSTIARLMWGQGIFTPHLLGLVSLACNQNYNLPGLFAQMAAQPPAELWSKERHTCGKGIEGVNQAAYKTPDFLLSSVQDYRPGEAGSAEHIWQATLGPGAVVFTNHPACSGESDAHAPGFWCGNGSLPRIAQWKDALVCIYHLPSDAPLGYTHAYFPTAAFDEYALNNGWAFARKGNAYLAIKAANGIELTRQGPYALRELRSGGAQNAWFCQLGRAERDGKFADFQKKVTALSFQWQDGKVSCATLGGDRLEFGWQGAFVVNQTEQPLQGFRHYENAYTTVDFPCTSMQIQVGEDILRLDLE
jgi:hypothetical protein